MRKCTALSLIELSIVLVILGLLVGGILAGQSLIRAAELRAVGEEWQRYRTAMHAFRDRYFAIPGDVTNATHFWGHQASGTSACVSGITPAGTPGTCNGNGDSMITGTEMFRSWQHLQFAGLLEGSYTGYRGPDGNSHHIAGENAPASRWPRAGWSLIWRSYGPGDSNYFPLSGNMLAVGHNGPTENDYFNNQILRGEEAWNIDRKWDDGLPGTGNIMTRRHAARPDCATSDEISYQLDNTAIGCNLIMKSGL